MSRGEKLLAGGIFLCFFSVRQPHPDAAALRCNFGVAGLPPIISFRGIPLADG